MNRSMAGMVVGSVMSISMICSCGSFDPGFTSLPVETRFSFVNLSTRFYAVLGIRETGGASTAFIKTSLLPPGALVRWDFRDFLQTGCPDSLDLQVFLYRRIDESIPIGLDIGEAVESTPIAAGQVMNIPACNVEPLVTYTIVNWEADEGTAHVKIAQGSEVETRIRQLNIFPNVDAAWEINGVEPSLADAAPTVPAPADSISGKVTLADGTGVPGMGVLLRTFFRTRLNDTDVTNDPDSGFSAPIAFTMTDAAGAFTLDRPAGGYKIEFFSDTHTFRPAEITVETPIEVVTSIAEPL